MTQVMIDHGFGLYIITNRWCPTDKISNSSQSVFWQYIFVGPLAYWRQLIRDPSYSLVVYCVQSQSMPPYIGLIMKRYPNLATAPFAAWLNRGNDYVSQFKSSHYIYSYKSYVMKLHNFANFMYLMLVLFIRKQKQAPNLVMFQSSSMRPMLLTETSLVEMCMLKCN